MEKYSIVLVDDEEEVRESIKNKLDWSGLGFKVVGTESNGRDAIELIESVEPDVLLTDIKMPYMNGLELIKCIRKKNKRMRVVIFSGYDEFESAREAILYNVNNYILKPINAEELTEVMSKIKESLDQEVDEKKNIHLLEAKYIESIPIIRQDLLNQMIRGDVNIEYLEDNLDNCGLGIARADKWVTVVIHNDGLTHKGIQEDNFKEYDSKLLSIFIKELMRKKINEQFKYADFSLSEGRCVIFALKKETKIEEIICILNEIVKESKKILDLKLSIGLGCEKFKLIDVKESFIEAKHALQYACGDQQEPVVYLKDVEYVDQNTIGMDTRIESELLVAIKFGDSHKVENILHEIVDNMYKSKLHVSHYQAYIISILNGLLQTVKSQNLDIQAVIGEPIDYCSILNSVGNQYTIYKWLEEICLKIQRSIRKSRENNVESLVYQAKEYIKENYMDVGLTVDSIACQVGLSSSYFSSLFKKEEGVNCITYLSNIRLKKAVELLGKTDYKTYMIAEKVGYSDANYFSYVFKKKYGVAPSKYRL